MNFNVFTQNKDLQHAIFLPMLNWNFILLGGHIQRVADSWMYPKEEHMVYELIYVIHGLEKIVLNDETIILHQGEFVIITPGTRHTVSAIKDLTYFCFHFDLDEPDLEERLLVTSRLLFQNKNARTKELTAYFDKMINTLKPKGDYDFADKMGIQITLSHILLGLYRESAKVTLSNNPSALDYARSIKVKIKRMLKYNIGCNLRDREQVEPVKLNVISEVCSDLNLSVGYCNRIYKKYYGSSPGYYINQLKLTYAKRLLTKPQLNIERVSFILGYKNPQNFSRFFRKYVGTSPKKYRSLNVNQTWDKKLYEANFTNLI